MIELGCFVSSHGYGHATRMAAVLEALAGRAGITPRIFSTAGEPLFAQTLQRFHYHHQLSDIGLVQDNAFHVDMKATCAQLDSLLPYGEELIERLARLCRNCACILCDISGLGIKVAERLGVPSVLIENFTWDWLYGPWRHSDPRLDFFIDYFSDIFASADYHIQTQPCCAPAEADLTCGPIFRRLRQNPGQLRRELGCDARPLVLISLGGIGLAPQFLGELQSFDSCFFVLGGQEREQRLGGNVLLLDRFSRYYHPDLIACADFVVFKSGYSTLAECYQCGTPALCIQRRDFAESGVLEHFARERMGCRILAQDDFLSGRWLTVLAEMKLTGQPAAARNGADEVALFMLSRLGVERG